MVIEIVFESHSVTVDNEEGRATGWLPGELSRQGRELAAELGRRRREDLPLRWSGQRVLVIGHVATRWGLARGMGILAPITQCLQVFKWPQSALSYFPVTEIRTLIYLDNSD